MPARKRSVARAPLAEIDPVLNVPGFLPGAVSGRKSANCIKGKGRYSVAKPSNTPTGRGMCANGFAEGTEAIGYDKRLYTVSVSKAGQHRWRLAANLPRPLPVHDVVKVKPGIDDGLGGWTKRPVPRRRKDPNAAPREPSAYNIFMREHMRSRPPGVAAKDHLSKGAALWTARKQKLR